MVNSKIINNEKTKPNCGISYQIEFQDKGEDCGFAYYNYFDPAVTTIYFPAYGARIDVSNTDN